VARALRRLLACWPAAAHAAPALPCSITRHKLGPHTARVLWIPAIVFVTGTVSARPPGPAGRNGPGRPRRPRPCHEPAPRPWHIRPRRWRPSPSLPSTPVQHPLSHAIAAAARAQITDYIYYSIANSTSAQLAEMSDFEELLWFVCSLVNLAALIM
jgi:hypothetical protein